MSYITMIILLLNHADEICPLLNALVALIKPLSVPEVTRVAAEGGPE
jgi:hypothetical protein